MYFGAFSTCLSWIDLFGSFAISGLSHFTYFASIKELEAKSEIAPIFVLSEKIRRTLISI